MSIIESQRYSLIKLHIREYFPNRLIDALAKVSEDEAHFRAQDPSEWLHPTQPSDHEARAGER